MSSRYSAISSFLIDRMSLAGIQLIGAGKYDDTSDRTTVGCFDFR